MSDPISPRLQKRIDELVADGVTLSDAREVASFELAGSDLLDENGQPVDED